MLKPFRVLVFGKPGCDKCHLLNQRLDKLLDSGEFTEFDKRYCDLETEEGLVRFAESECINPQQIPALLVTRRDPSSGRYLSLSDPRPGDPERPGGSARLHQYMGLRTDYSGAARGVITPKMIEAVLHEARDR
ncbi:MAG: hypothetical protein R6W82_02460 [bacterium]